jgi:hypothetical protein
MIDTVFAQTTAKSATSDNTVAMVGLIVAGVVGLGGPLLAAVFASRRQKDQLDAAETRQTAELDATETRQREALDAERARQNAALAAERERLERQLTAERERQAAQLAHARELADLADLRALLDEAAGALHRADNARAEVRLGITQHGVKIAERGPDAIKELNASGRELDAMAARLAVRLGSIDPISRAFHSADYQLLQISRALGWLEDETTDSWRGKRVQIVAWSDAFERHIEEFKRAAVARTAARVGEEPSRPSSDE